MSQTLPVPAHSATRQRKPRCRVWPGSVGLDADEREGYIPTFACLKVLIVQALLIVRAPLDLWSKSCARCLVPETEKLGSDVSPLRALSRAPGSSRQPLLLAASALDSCRSRAEDIKLL